jgi:hypothetical protein
MYNAIIAPNPLNNTPTYHLNSLGYYDQAIIQEVVDGFLLLFKLFTDY